MSNGRVKGKREKCFQGWFPAWGDRETSYGGVLHGVFTVEDAEHHLE